MGVGGSVRAERRHTKDDRVGVWVVRTAIAVGYHRAVTHEGVRRRGNLVEIE